MPKRFYTNLIYPILCVALGVTILLLLYFSEYDSFFYISSHKETGILFYSIFSTFHLFYLILGGVLLPVVFAIICFFYLSAPFVLPSRKFFLSLLIISIGNFFTYHYQIVPPYLQVWSTDFSSFFLFSSVILFVLSFSILWRWNFFAELARYFRGNDQYLKSSETSLSTVKEVLSRNWLVRTADDPLRPLPSAHAVLKQEFTQEVRPSQSRSLLDDEKRTLIEQKLSDFAIEAKVTNILCGPLVDTYELELGSGVRVAKILSVADDLSLAMFGAPLRIVTSLRGKNTVGIEVPRDSRDTIYLEQMLRSAEFERCSASLPIAIGMDAYGSTIISDLSLMPHLLVAGSTGSGKSVFINTLLASLLVKKVSNRLKLVLIDPKQLELAAYEELPHLALPVIVDPKDASYALQWLIYEMERRYQMLRELGVRNLENYNARISRADLKTLEKLKSYYSDDNNTEWELPLIVVVVDEFADLILGKIGKDIELSICRLAAKARAAGIHLVIATQRPSVDVITGLIKANFPVRISFKLPSSIDSRTILNSVGAEKLLGKGDMLFCDGSELKRVHGAYVGEQEIDQLTSIIRTEGVRYLDSALEYLEKARNSNEVGLDGMHDSMLSEQEQDALYQEALKIVMSHKSVSASMLQRKLRIGFNRASNLVDYMELQGVVGPAVNGKPREVFATDAIIDLNNRSPL